MNLVPEINTVDNIQNGRRWSKLFRHPTQSNARRAHKGTVTRGNCYVLIQVRTKVEVCNALTGSVALGVGAVKGVMSAIDVEMMVRYTTQHCHCLGIGSMRTSHTVTVTEHSPMQVKTDPSK